MIVAITGVILIAFVVGHLLGNLQIFLGPDWINSYAEHLRALVREPRLGHVPICQNESVADIEAGADGLKLRDPMAVETDMVVDAASEPGGPLVIWWDGGATLRNAALRAGVSKTHIIDGRLPAEERPNVEADLQTVFSRPWTRLFVQSHRDKEVADRDTVGHRGALIGRVEAVRDGATREPKLRFRTRRALEKHDGLQVDLPHFGVRYAPRFTESIALMRRLWTGEKVTFDGRFYSVKDHGISLKPLQAGGPPVWVAGLVEAAVQRAAQIGDAWLIALNQAAAASGIVTYIRLMPEMDGHWNPYSAFNSDGSRRDGTHSTAAFRRAWACAAVASCSAGRFHAIIFLSSMPTFSIGWFSALARMSRNRWRPWEFSFIHSRANAPL